MLINANWFDVVPEVGEHHADSETHTLTSPGEEQTAAFGRQKQTGRMPDYVGRSRLHCLCRRGQYSQKEAQTVIAAAVDLLENRDEWWNVLRAND
jgi:hypothetical protein